MKKKRKPVEKQASSTKEIVIFVMVVLFVGCKGDQYWRSYQQTTEPATHTVVQMDAVQIETETTVERR